MSNAEVELVGVHDRISAALAGLKDLFAPGMCLTFVARHPGHPERYLLVSDDPGQLAMQAFVRAGCPEGSATSQSAGDGTGATGDIAADVAELKRWVQYLRSWHNSWTGEQATRLLRVLAHLEDVTKGSAISQSGTEGRA